MHKINSVSDTPFNKMQTWIEQERNLGSPKPENIVLATATSNGIPHSRIVAIREILPNGILFFTQSEKRKAKELSENAYASMTLWLPLQQKQVILEGKTLSLSEADNDSYWNTLPRERQLIFATYSSVSDQKIDSLSELQEKQNTLIAKYKGKDIPRENHYKGFILNPTDIYFYTLGTDTFFELMKYSLEEDRWKINLLSP